MRAVFFTVLALLVCAQESFAQVSRPFAAPDASTPAQPAGASGLGEVTLALLVVLAAIFGLAWLVRRLRGFSRSGSNAIEVVAEVGLGTRERAVLVKIGTTRLLLGVAPGRVSALHVLGADEKLPEDTGRNGGSASASGPARPTFLSILQKSLGR